MGQRSPYRMESLTRDIRAGEFSHCYTSKKQRRFCSSGIDRGSGFYRDRQRAYCIAPFQAVREIAWRQRKRVDYIYSVFVLSLLLIRIGGLASISAAPPCG